MITKKQKRKIGKAHELKMTVREAAAYSDVSRDCVRINWKGKELKPHYKKSSPRNRDVPAEIFLEDVFYAQQDELGFLEIKEIVEKSLGYLVDDEILAKGLDSMVDLGFYEKVLTGEGEKYRSCAPYL